MEDTAFGAPMDVWAIGCVTFEMAARVTLFRSKDRWDMICRIFEAVGLPVGNTLEYFAFLPLWAPTLHAVRKPAETLEVRFSRFMSIARAQWLQSLLTLDPRSRPAAEHAVRSFL